MRLIVPLLLLAGCASQQQPSPPDACSERALAEIQARYVAAAAEACAGKTPTECTVLPSLKRQRDAEVARWVKCSP